MILTQNTEKVLSTKDLGSRFEMVAGFHFDKQKSNDTFKYYSAAGAHISIGNYNDETKLELCMVEGCEYVMNLLLEVTENTRTLKIDVSYGGGILLNELIAIDKVTIYYDDTTATSDLVNPVEIKGPL